MATTDPTYRLKPESTLSTIHPDETKVLELEAAPDVDAQEEDLDEEHKEKEARENRFLALEKSVAILQQTAAVRTDEIISLEKAVAVLQDNTASLEKAVAAQEDEIMSLEKAVAAQEDKIMSLEKAIAAQEDEIMSLEKADDALSARVGVLEAWVEKMKPIFGEVAEKANQLARSSSTPTPSSATSFRLSVRRTRKRARNNNE